jgi:group I intron endonuclease
MKSGIYCIRNISNNKVYVGKATYLKGRISSHKHLLRKNKHVNIYLQHAWNKYGEDAFEFSILQECKRDLLPEMEAIWVKTKNANNPDYGYNLMVVGRYNHHHSEETKQKMRNSSLGKKKSKEHVHNGTLTKYKAIIQYDLEGNFINEWLGASYVRDKLGYNQGNITAVCNGKRSTAHGYIWKYKN